MSPFPEFSEKDSSVSSSSSGGAREPLAHFPQLLPRGVVSCSGPHLLQRAVGEVAAAQRLQALLQGAVQAGLGSRLGVQQEQLGQRRQDELQPKTEAATQFCVDDACGGGAE